MCIYIRLVYYFIWIILYSEFFISFTIQPKGKRPISLIFLFLDLCQIIYSCYAEIKMQDMMMTSRHVVYETHIFFNREYCITDDVRCLFLWNNAVKHQRTLKSWKRCWEWKGNISQEVKYCTSVKFLWYDRQILLECIYCLYIRK